MIFLFFFETYNFIIPTRFHLDKPCPKGQLLSEVETMLPRGAPKLDENGSPMRDARGNVPYEPYRIKVLNTINFKMSMKHHYFTYIRSEKDILKLVNIITSNTKGNREKASKEFGSRPSGFCTAL